MYKHRQSSDDKVFLTLGAYMYMTDPVYIYVCVRDDHLFKLNVNQIGRFKDGHLQQVTSN